MSDPSPVIAAAWGLCGAAPYCGTRLATALWSRAEVTSQARKLAVAQFVIAIFTGPAFAAALAPPLSAHVRGANLASVSCFVGLFANAAWPVLTDRQVAARILAGFGGWLMRWGVSLGPGEGRDEP